MKLGFVILPITPVFSVGPPNQMHLTRRTKEFVQAQQELLEAGTPSVGCIFKNYTYMCLQTRRQTMYESIGIMLSW